jgi:hypothetical protein
LVYTKIALRYRIAKAWYWHWYKSGRNRLTRAAASEESNCEYSKRRVGSPGPVTASAKKGSCGHDLTANECLELTGAAILVFQVATPTQVARLFMQVFSGLVRDTLQKMSELK